MDLQLDITKEMLNSIAEIDEFKGEWKVVRGNVSAKLEALRKEQTSNAYLDNEELASFTEAMDIVLSSYDQVPLTEDHIKQLHSLLFKHLHGDLKQRGQYKRQPDMFATPMETASPFETPLKMQELMRWTTKQMESKEWHPIIVAAVFTAVFMTIHPFSDGNDRLAKILMTWILMKAGYTYIPFQPLKELLDFHKESYYSALRRTRSSMNTEKVDWEQWILFFLKIMKLQKDRLGQELSHEEEFGMELPDLSLQIVDLVKTHGRLSISRIRDLTEANRNTLKVHLRKLVEEKHLSKFGQGRGVWYGT
ncbi:MAG: Fic family protein [Chlamydiales bacterium]|jgi:Fic family protein